LKITRRKFLGLAASVAILPSGLLGREVTSFSGTALRGSAGVNATGLRAKIARKLFLDESGNDSGRYVVAGCLAVDAALAPDVKLRLLKSVGENSRPRWNRLSRSNLESHRRMLAAVFDAIGKNQLSFDYVIVPNSDSLHGSRTGYSSAAHKLLLDYATARRDTHNLYIYPQRRPANVALGNYRRVLNREVSNGASDSIPIRLIENRDAHRSIFNQALDVMVGAIAYRANGHCSRDDAGAAKRALADYVAARIGEMPRNPV
jgi:hypothetical protein